MGTIVLIEDSPWIRKGLAETIPWSQLGLTLVGVAGDGLEGHDLILRLNPHFAIVDIMMPGRDGLAMIEALKKNPAIQTQYIIMSAHNEFPLTRKALTMGVLDYLLKPVREKELVELLTRIQKQLPRGADGDLSAILLGFSGLDPEFRRFLKLRSPSPSVDPLLQYTLRRMEEIYASSISLRDICTELKVSESNLSRRFKRSLGFTFVEFLNMLRVWRAVELFADPLVRIGEVSVLVGISDQRYFSMVFKRAIGMTPSQFRATMGFA